MFSYNLSLLTTPGAARSRPASVVQRQNIVKHSCETGHGHKKQQHSTGNSVSGNNEEDKWVQPGDPVVSTTPPVAAGSLRQCTYRTFFQPTRGCAGISIIRHSSSAIMVLLAWWVGLLLHPRTPFQKFLAKLSPQTRRTPLHIRLIRFSLSGFPPNPPNPPILLHYFAFGPFSWDFYGATINSLCAVNFTTR